MPFLMPRTEKKEGILNSARTSAILSQQITSSRRPRRRTSGAEEDVDEMIKRIKDQNWHALSLRACVRYTYTRPAQVSNEGSSTHDLALLHCPLAQNHSSNNNNTDTGGSHASATNAKLRPGVEEIETMSDLVGRLRAVGVPEAEYTEALGLRT
ncbi:hypothetical protein A4X13_0g3131 [Tilletia indica]|uniref:Uncharacterized protein n=1 Tax=Tilletia indica TaxID=43049 RepID=A0A8T8T337_9BASI|nr:hypothetical protein A4X13_0g3131 [Tilletia indica]